MVIVCLLICLRVDVLWTVFKWQTTYYVCTTEGGFEFDRHQHHFCSMTHVLSFYHSI